MSNSSACMPSWTCVSFCMWGCEILISRVSRLKLPDTGRPASLYMGAGVSVNSKPRRLRAPRSALISNRSPAVVGLFCQRLGLRSPSRSFCIHSASVRGSLGIGGASGPGSAGTLSVNLPGSSARRSCQSRRFFSLIALCSACACSNDLGPAGGSSGPCASRAANPCSRALAICSASRPSSRANCSPTGSSAVV